MGRIQEPAHALLIMSAFSRYGEALDWARREAEALWGPVGLESPRFDFVETDYYEPTMGPGLKKVFFAFERLVDSAQLPEIKHQTNAWEAHYAEQFRDRHSEPRPLNLDPGYLNQAKLILASTKDHSHRVYIARGIYGEVTLHYQDRRWQQRDWTFPDYRRDDYHQFFTTCREYLRRRTSKDFNRAN